MEEISFGNWLSRRRKWLGLTQKQLAERVNCATITVRKIESEQRRPSRQIVERLAQIINIPPEEREAFFQYARGYRQSQSVTDVGNFPWQPNGSVFSQNMLTSLLSHFRQDHHLPQINGYIIDANTHLIHSVVLSENSEAGWNLEVMHGIPAASNDTILFIMLLPIEIPHHLAPVILRNLNEPEIRGRLSLYDIESRLEGLPLSNINFSDLAISARESIKSKPKYSQKL